MARARLIHGLVALLATGTFANPQQVDFDAMAAAGPPPQPSIATGVLSQVVQYQASSMVSAAAAEITSEPLTGDSSGTSTAGDYEVQAKRTLPAGCDARPPQPTGAGLVPSQDNASAFLANTYYANVASAAPTPTGYEQTFKNLQAENNALGYLGYTVMNTYDVAGCAAQCTAMNGCAAINVAFERDPIVDPGDGCQDPPSTTVIKCVFWGSPVTKSNAVNTGQWRGGFQVVVAGSNGYVNTSAFPIVDYNSTYYGNYAINAPYDCNGANTYMGYKYWNDGWFDANRCAAACTAQNAYNLAHPPANGVPPMICNYFNTYILNYKGIPQGQVCSMYTETWAPQYAVNSGYSNGTGAFTITSSYGYTNTSNPHFCVQRPRTNQCSNPGTCGTYQSSNPSQNCYCGTDPTGIAISFQNSYCGSQASCNTNSDCDPGSSCLVGSCCNRNVCVPTSVCTNPASRSRLFRKRDDAEEYVWPDLDDESASAVSEGMDTEYNPGS